jgi:hypothetical protein
MHRKLEEAAKAVAGQIKKKPANNVPMVSFRFGVVQSLTGASPSTALVLFAGASTAVPYRWLYSGGSFNPGDTVVVARYGSDGFILGKLAP